MESILGVLLVSEYAAAHAQYHRPMPPYQYLECRFVALAREAFQELMVTERTDPVDLNQMLDVLPQTRRCAAHGFPLARLLPSIFYANRGLPHSDVFNYSFKPRLRNGLVKGEFILPAVREAPN